MRPSLSVGKLARVIDAKGQPQFLWNGNIYVVKELHGGDLVEFVEMPGYLFDTKRFENVT